MTLRLVIPKWHPTTTNKLIGCHWATAARRKATDRNVISAYCAVYRIPIATGPRRVDLIITRGQSQRGKDPDPDAFWKSCLDALVGARMLINDDKHYCKPGDVTFERGSERATTIQLTDIDGAMP